MFLEERGNGGKKGWKEGRKVVREGKRKIRRMHEDGGKGRGIFRERQRAS